MAEAHSTHTCEVCGATFTRKLNKDGSERKARYSLCSDYCRRKQLKARGHSPEYVPAEKTEKRCGTCGAVFVGHLRQKYCCARCGSEAKYSRKRLTERRLGPFNCEHCYQPFYAKKRTEAKFCGRQCAFDRWGLVAEERAALRRVQRANKISTVRTRSNVKLEASALRRIAYAWKVAKGVCHVCGETYARLRAWQRTCSRDCEAKQVERVIAAARKCKKAQKAKRRAIKKGALAESIDPIKVFERDKWRCHICGKKTRKELRGSSHADAPELEHIVSLADGGSHTWGNVACSCRACNCKKGSASFGQLGLGFAV